MCTCRRHICVKWCAHADDIFVL